MLGAKPDDEVDDEKLRVQQEREEMEDKMSAYEQLGVGNEVPKEILDGSFTKRSTISDDKLLQQLIGHKAAKAHLAAKQASKSGLQSSTVAKPSKPTKKEESEDEDEGRTAMFKSKRQRIIPNISPADSGPNDRETRSNDDTQDIAKAPPKDIEQDPEDNDSEPKAPVKKSRPGKKKPISYLDQILAERSKKKKK